MALLIDPSTPVSATQETHAQALSVIPKTVEVHLSSVYRKLGISSRSHLAGPLSSPLPAD